MKKIMAAIMTATLVLSSGFLPAAEGSAVFNESGVITASAAEVSGDFNYEIQDDGTVEITEYTGEGGDVTIPGTIDGKSVTSIGDFAFCDCSSLTGITIPDGVTSIRYEAFSGCSSLTSITIPDSVTSIEWYAFSDCSSLTGITIPDSVTSIGEYAFSECSSLTGITIPASVTSIGYGAFCDCSSLTSINVSNSKNYISKDGVLFDKDVTELIAYPCGNARTTYSIPTSVTSIGEWAFGGCSSLTSITIPDSVTSIGDSAFEDCSSLTSITIPDSVTSIGEYTFYGCDSLTDVYFKGTREQWDDIEIRTDNECLTNATIHFNSSNNNNTHKHQYGNWTTTKAATCTEKGEEQRSCSCGEKETREIPALGHTYSTKWTIDQAATCKATGSKSHHCTRCGEKKDVTTIPKTAHKYSWKTIKKATSKVNGKQQGKCSVCGKTTTREIISLARIKISVSNKTYTGKQIKPVVTVSYGKTKLKANTDYTIKYGTNKATGKGTVTITGKGKYVGKVTKTFKILPRKTTVSLKSSSRGKITVSYTKKSEAVKYKIQYADNSKFKKATTKTVSAKTTKLTVSGKSKKTYYVRVSVIGKDGTDSGWSSAKKIKVK